MKNRTVLFAFLLFGAPLMAQKQAPEAAPRVLDFTVTPDGDGYRFTPIPPPLQQKAGAPLAFWTYYWEFGDGSYSFEEKPLHKFGKVGGYDPILEATAHYDDGKLPTKKGKGIMASQIGGQPGDLPTVFDSIRLPIRMVASRQARANEELTCILSYRNLGMVRTDGRVHLFFNERRFPSSHFALDSARLHFNEKVDAAVSQVLPMDVPSTNGWTLLNLPSHTGVSSALPAEAPSSEILENLLSNARGAYKDEKIWRFTDLQPGEKRNMFVALHGTDKMLQDTNAFIHVEAIFAPFDPLIPAERYELEFEIVSSHDPNAIIVSDSRVNYRSFGKKKLDYKVQFQNNGEGPASTVEVKVEIPEGLDMKRMRPLEWYPKCPICPKPLSNRSCIDTTSTKDGLVFTFRNIYLPGSRQKGVDERDSTKGFVRYRIEAERNMPKTPFRSRAKITFDKNAPIYTNFTRTRFKVGISPGLKAGYAFEPNFSTSDNTSGEEQEEKEPFVQNGYVFLGASLSPFKSWRIYPQVELLTGIKGREETVSMSSNVDTLPANPAMDFTRITIDSVMEETSQGFVSFELPVLLRKNFTRFFGAGIGGSAMIQFNNGETRVRNREIVIEQIPGQDPMLRSDSIYVSTTSLSSKPIRYRAFVDLTFGSVRQGLNLGIRGGAMLERKRKLRPFVQLSLELKL
ncbi:MAG: PKD domain-containing protein [Lewinellaceae bacterium]|nr:PKD domain-containing protein [Lewinellaceae bacterium]